MPPEGARRRATEKVVRRFKIAEDCANWQADALQASSTLLGCDAQIARKKRYPKEDLRSGHVESSTTS